MQTLRQYEAGSTQRAVSGDPMEPRGALFYWLDCLATGDELNAGSKGDTMPGWPAIWATSGHDVALMGKIRGCWHAIEQVLLPCWVLRLHLQGLPSSPSPLVLRLNDELLPARFLPTPAGCLLAPPWQW